jgi:hypothetical protein
VHATAALRPHRYRERQSKRRDGNQATHTSRIIALIATR